MNLNRPLPEPYRDVALLVARVLLGVVMFAHGYQKMVIDGIGRTSDGFESMSVPLAIVSASFVTVVEFAGSALLVLGALTPLVAVGNLVVTGGAVVFVHATNGIFVADGGWELVGVIGAGFVLLAVVGPGRYSVDHVLTRRQREHRDAMAKARPAVDVRPRAAAADAFGDSASGGSSDGGSSDDPSSDGGTSQGEISQGGSSLEDTAAHRLWTPPEGVAAGGVPRRTALPRVVPMLRR